MKKTIWTAALAAASFIAAPAAQASTVSTGWVRNAVVSQPACISLAHQVAEDGGYTVVSSDVSASLKNDDGDLIMIVCDAAPYVFFLAVHDTKTPAQVEAMANWTEARLRARIDALH